ncbi:hypothetical protein ANO11243_024040 [Dothideomycetidae sp. 11243]|nr:hypothetical protein ANO11243_024040 [fungal sp. No.11243]
MENDHKAVTKAEKEATKKEPYTIPVCRWKWGQSLDWIVRPSGSSV